MSRPTPDIFDKVRLPPEIAAHLREMNPWWQGLPGRVLTIGEKRIPVEVKYRRRIEPHRDTLGLRSFLEKTHYHAPFAVLVTMLEDVAIPDRRIVPVSLRSLLLAR